MDFLTFHANCLLLRRKFHEIQNLFSGVYKKNIKKKKCRLPKLLPGMQSLNETVSFCFTRNVCFAAL